MKYTLRNETAKDKFERLSVYYKFHYKRTNGKEVDLTYNKGYVTINGDKFRLSQFEKALLVLRSRPTINNKNQ